MNNKLKKKSSILLIIFFFIQQFVYTGVLEEGKKKLKKAKHSIKIGISSSEVNEIFNEAYHFFKNGTDEKSKLYYIYLSDYLKKKYNKNKLIIEILRGLNQRELSYVKIIESLELLETNEKNSLKKKFEKIEANIPRIAKISIKNKTLYPYKDNNNFGINFSLNTNAYLSYSIFNSIISSDVWEGKGVKALDFKWKYDYLQKDYMSIQLFSKNEYSSDKKEIKIKFIKNIPSGLYLYEDVFKIRGKYEKNEEKTIKKITKTGKLIGFIGSGILVLSTIASLSLNKVNKPSSENSVYKYSVGIGVAGLLGFLLRKKVNVPDKINISYNKQLKKEIEEKKKNIKVKLELE